LFRVGASPTASPSTSEQIMAPKRSSEAVAGAEAPKRPQSGYGLFFGDKRAEIAAALLKEGVDQKKIMTSSAKRAGELWGALSDAGKKPFNDRAEDLKVAYAKELETFKAKNPDFIKVKKVKKGAVDKGPKRPLTAYPMWLGDNRAMLTEKVMKEHKVDKPKAFLMLYKEGKTLYDALSEAEKKKCEDQAQAAKDKFQAEMKAWKEKNKASKAGGAEAEEDEGEDEGEDEEEEEEAEEDGKADEEPKTPSPKRAKTAEKITEKTSAPKEKVSRVAKPATEKGARKSKGPEAADIDASVIKQAQNLGYEAALRNLALRPDVMGLGKTDADLLAAIKISGGLVNQARRALLGA